MSMEQRFDQLSLSPRMDMNMMMFEEVEEQKNNPSVIPLGPPPIPSFLPDEWDPIDIQEAIVLKPFDPCPETEFEQILSLTSISYNYRQLAEKLYDQHIRGKATYDTELKLKELRGGGEEKDEWLQNSEETDIQYKKRRARYWEELDSKSCVRCDINRAQSTKEQLPDLEKMDLFVRDNRHKMGKNELYQKVFDTYNYLIRPNLPDMFIDPYTKEPRPARFWSKAQCENHYEHHCEDIPTRRENRLKKYNRLFNMMYKSVREQEKNSKKQRWATGNIKTLMEIDKRIELLEKTVRNDRGGGGK